MFEFLRSRRRKREALAAAVGIPAQNPAAGSTPTGPAPAQPNFYLPSTAAEKETVGAIASAILAGDKPDSRFKIQNIYRVDTDKEAAAVIAAAIAAGDNPETTLRIKNIYEIH